MNELTRIAIAGTAKLSTTLPPGGTPLDDDWNSLGLEPERALLLRAGADATTRLAGYVAPSSLPVPQPAEDEELSECSNTVAQMLTQLLTTPRSPILIEVLTLLAERRRRLPPVMLPKILEVNDPLVREAIRPVIGERGRWLSQFNPAWRWAAQGIDAELPANILAIWEQGTMEERLAVLERVRVERPAEASEWLEQVWRVEKANFRQQALEVFQQGLSLDDQPFLERALDDRSQNVRERAAALLVSLPDSALVDRMRVRADAMLQFTPPAPTGRIQKFLRSVTASSAQGTFAVTLPEKLDKSWQRDYISEDPPTGIGRLTWWFMQVIANVPPSHWETRWNTRPAELIATAVADSEYGLPILKGWSEAAIRYREPAWALALWHVWLGMKTKDSFFGQHRIRFLEELVAGLPPQQANNLATEQFTRARLAEDVHLALIRALPAPWTPTFGALFLESAYPFVTSKIAYNWQDALSTAAIALPPQNFALAFERYGAFRDKPGGWQIADFLDTLETRQRFYEEINR